MHYEHLHDKLKDMEEFMTQYDKYLKDKEYKESVPNSLQNKMQLMEEDMKQQKHKYLEKELKNKQLKDKKEERNIELAARRYREEKEELKRIIKEGDKIYHDRHIARLEPISFYHGKFYQLNENGHKQEISSKYEQQKKLNTSKESEEKEEL
jgi:hypothetical protein